jgi:uncharacterized membrane protein YdjX (TVP38/TMEM64 family)
MSRGRLLLFAAVVAAAVLVVVYRPGEEAVLRRAAAWRQAARDEPAAALAVFAAAEVLLIAVSAPVGIWLSILAGYLFGVWVGTAVVSVAATTGAVLAFLSARHLFAAALRRAADTRPRLGRRLAKVEAGFREHGAYYVLLLRLTPVIPFWVLNLGLGLTGVRLRDYWWATQLGMLPITLVLANVGASLTEVESFRGLLSARVLGALCLLPLVPFVLHHTAGRRLKTEPRMDTDETRIRPKN